MQYIDWSKEIARLADNGNLGSDSETVQVLATIADALQEINDSLKSIAKSQQYIAKEI